MTLQLSQLKDVSSMRNLESNRNNYIYIIYFTYIKIPVIFNSDDPDGDQDADEFTLNYRVIVPIVLSFVILAIIGSIIFIIHRRSKSMTMMIMMIVMNQFVFALVNPIELRIDADCIFLMYFKRNAQS